MDYYDDLLNVYAYLFHKDNELAESAARLDEKINRTAEAYQTLNEKTDTLLSDVDRLLSKAYVLAEKNQIDVRDLRCQPKPASAAAGIKDAAPSVPRVRLPYDFDFQKDFHRLAKEARDAGFTNVHPEHLLTPEEMQHAEEFAHKLNHDFFAATRLQEKDMFILMAAVAARVLVFSLMGAYQSDSQAQQEQDTVPPAELYESPMGAVSLAAPSDAVDALQGVDLSGILSQVSDIPLTESFSCAPFPDEPAAGSLLPPDMIWSRDNLFRFPDTEILEKDILATKPVLGWLFGVLNILTDTVTTKNFQSFRVDYDPWNLLSPAVGQPVSTMSQIIRPVIENAVTCKESLICAVMQEARILGFCKADLEQLHDMFERAQILEQKLTDMESAISKVENVHTADFLKYVSGIGISAFLNTLVAAIHAITYDAADGDLDTFCIRTNRIVLCANAISAMINSSPGFLAKDWTSLDYAGMITTFVTLVQSHRFWINVKANFLVSEFSREIQKEMDLADQYIEFY